MRPGAWGYLWSFEFSFCAASDHRGLLQINWLADDHQDDRLVRHRPARAALARCERFRRVRRSQPGRAWRHRPSAWFCRLSTELQKSLAVQLDNVARPKLTLEFRQGGDLRASRALGPRPSYLLYANSWLTKVSLNERPLSRTWARQAPDFCLRIEAIFRVKIGCSEKLRRGEKGRRAAGGSAAPRCWNIKRYY